MEKDEARRVNIRAFEVSSSKPKMNRKKWKQAKNRIRILSDDSRPKEQFAVMMLSDETQSVHQSKQLIIVPLFVVKFISIFNRQPSSYRAARQALASRSSGY